MKKKGLYQLKKSDKKIKEYTLSVLTEDKAGLLNHITIIFNRRKLNIDSLNVSTSAAVLFYEAQRQRRDMKTLGKATQSRPPIAMNYPN